jgi:glycosyltransferase involved in cell wall biosynthesis
VIKASVIIPTKNPGTIFRQVLARVLEQEAPWPFEVIVIDSGSNDGTVEFAQSHAAVKVIAIPPHEFGHGKTRNLAISRSSGEFAVLLTHDALPADTAWLREIVAAVEQSPDIGGAFGRHIAYPEATAYTQRDIDLHFSGFLQHSLVVSRNTDPQRYAGDQGWRQFLHYYSDNNSCLRRSVWEQIPYPDVEFAEDQIWARNIIEAGWAKAYAQNAAVYHSHDYGKFERLQRAYDESCAFRRLFGYRLGGSTKQMWRSIIWLCRNDWRWGRKNKLPNRAILHQIGEDVALVLGHGLGARGDSLPQWLQARLSRDKKLFRSLGVNSQATDEAKPKGRSMLRGLKSLLKGKKQQAAAAQPVATNEPPKIDIVGFWQFIIAAESFGPELTAANAPASNSINWFVPPFGMGSGGHLNIFRFVRNLENQGFDCRIIICNDHSGTSSEVLQKQIGEWFFQLKAPVYKYPQQEIPVAAISVATGWQTAYPVRAFRGTRHRCYFVQDFEPFFNPPGTEYALAEETYRFGFVGITAGDWLARKLHDEYGMETHAFQFSFDHDLYKPYPRRDAIQRVFFYARPPTPRRAFDLGVLVLAELAKRMPDVEMVLAGWDVNGYELPFRNLKCGILSVAELPDLYSHCDAALVLSFTNASLLPPELMACGCVVVSNTGPNNEWLLDEDCAVIAKPTVTAMADALQRVLQEKTYRENIVQQGYLKANSTTWEHEAEKVAAIFRELVNRNG